MMRTQPRPCAMGDSDSDFPFAARLQILTILHRKKANRMDLKHSQFQYTIMLHLYPTCNADYAMHVVVQKITLIPA